MARQNGNNKVDYKKLVSRFKSNNDGSAGANRAANYADMVSGELAPKMIKWLKVNGLTESRQPIRWSRCFEEFLLLQADLRIAEVYTTGAAQLQKTITNALVNSYLSQVLGLRTAWAFPKEKLVDVNVPRQHSKILDHFTAIQGVKRKNTHSTSNRLYDVGIGSSSFFGIVSGDSSGGAAAGANIVSFTADVAFVEEASQVKQALISPLISRVEQSISPQQPLRNLGTPGSGTGIELAIEEAEYYFWPHLMCPHCGEEVLLDPRGCLLKPHTEVNKQGLPETRYLSRLGTAVDWLTDADGKPIFGCSHCQGILSQEVRSTSYLRCIKTGFDVPTFLSTVVPERWEKTRLKVALCCSPLIRDKPTHIVAATIIEKLFDPETAADVCQQQLGLPFTATSSSITETQWITACKSKKPPKSTHPDSVKVLGIDQGRADWYGVTATFHYNYELESSENLKHFIIEINDFYCDNSKKILEAASEFGTEVGLIDNEPSIYLGAEVCQEWGYHMADQQPRQLDDYKIGESRDAGIKYPCWKIRDPKFGFLILEAFMEGRVVMPERFLASLTDRTIKSPAKHLRSVSWDSGTAQIIKAADDIDHLFFALLFAVAGFAIFLDHPGKMLAVSDLSWV